MTGGVAETKCRVTDLAGYFIAYIKFYSSGFFFFIFFSVNNSLYNSFVQNNFLWKERIGIKNFLKSILKDTRDWAVHVWSGLQRVYVFSVSLVLLNGDKIDHIPHVSEVNIFSSFWVAEDSNL